GVFNTTATQTTWFQLSPSLSANIVNGGDYVNGTWSTVPSTMNTARLNFPTAMLPDGRIFAIGGGFSPSVAYVNAPEIYNPLTNTWTPVAPVPTPPTQLANFPSLAPASPQSQFGDAPIEVLPNGDVLVGYFNGPQTYIYNVATNTWRQPSQLGGSKLRNDK